MNIVHHMNNFKQLMCYIHREQKKIAKFQMHVFTTSSHESDCFPQGGAYRLEIIDQRPLDNALVRNPGLAVADNVVCLTDYHLP